MVHKEGRNEKLIEDRIVSNENIIESASEQTRVSGPRHARGTEGDIFPKTWLQRFLTSLRDTLSGFKLSSSAAKGAKEEIAINSEKLKERGGFPSEQRTLQQTVTRNSSFFTMACLCKSDEV